MIGRSSRARLGLAVVLLACRGREQANSHHAAVTPRALDRSASPSASAGPTPPPKAVPRALPALSANWLERLDLGEEGHAVVAVPVGAREPRPVMIAVHGAGDRPEWACGGWRIVVDAYPFVVCPQGVPVDKQRFAWSNSAAIARAIERSVAALERRFGGYVAGEPKIYAGFSQGATLSRPILLGARRFDTVIFAEGGYEISASAEFARRFRELGGERVLLACGTPGCFSRAASAKQSLERAGLSVLVAGDAGSGHNLNEPMQRALRAAWPGLVVGRPGWQR